jgi:hypothetical protein
MHVFAFFLMRFNKINTLFITRPPPNSNEFLKNPVAAAMKVLRYPGFWAIDRLPQIVDTPALTLRACCLVSGAGRCRHNPLGHPVYRSAKDKLAVEAYLMFHRRVRQKFKLQAPTPPGAGVREGIKTKIIFVFRIFDAGLFN